MTQKEHRNSILLVDDDISNLRSLNLILSDEYNVYTVNNGEDSLKVAKKHMPDIILLDILMPNMDGYEVFKKLKSDTETRSIPIIFITSLDDPKDEEKGLTLGAADYITKPFNPTAVKLRIHNQMKIINQIETIKELSLMDQLTKIPNRQGFDERLRLEWDRAKRNNSHLSILIMDIDYFKKYNDTYGHLQGDIALKIAANVAQNSLSRSVDFIARWGGEEFATLLPDTNSEGAKLVAETIRQNIEKTDVPCNDGTITKITVSIGINTIIPSQDDISKDFFIFADKALYKAKESGRNQVCVYDESTCK